MNLNNVFFKIVVNSDPLCGVDRQIEYHTTAVAVINTVYVLTLSKIYYLKVNELQ